MAGYPRAGYRPCATMERLILRQGVQQEAAAATTVCDGGLSEKETYFAHVLYPY